MPSEAAVPRQRVPLHETVARPPERPRGTWDLLGRLNDAVDILAAPVAFGAAAWLSACRLTWLMRCLKADDDPCTEFDLIA